MAGRRADLVVLSGEDRTFLEAQVRRHKAPRSLSDRCRMILLCAEGLQSKEVAERLGVHEHTVGKWRRRFVQDGIAGLTRKQLQRGVHRSTAELETDIIAFIEAHNENPKPYNGPNLQTKSSPPLTASAKNNEPNFGFR
jgi:transposase-like protein